MKVYSIYDQTAEVWYRPYYARADGEATRIFADLVNDRDTPYGRHPADFTCYRVGTFNEETGDLEGNEHRKLAHGVELVVVEDTRPLFQQVGESVKKEAS